MSLRKANSFAFLSEVTLEKKVFVRSQAHSKDVK